MLNSDIGNIHRSVKGKSPQCHFTLDSLNYKLQVATRRGEDCSGLPKGALEILLYRGKHSGTYYRVLRVEPDFPGSEKSLKHDFDEVVYIIRGGLVESVTGEVYPVGTVAFFPDGLKHGPHTAPVGTLMIGFRHYKPGPAIKSR